MITGKFIRGDQDLSEAKEIRMSVFVDEQGFPAESEMDEYDARAIHCLLYNDDHKPSATARLFIDDDGYWRIGRVAVLREMRGKQLGDLAMRMVLDKALQAGAKRFRLSSQKQAEGFYRLYGFEPTGEETDDCGVHRLPRRTDAGAGAPAGGSRKERKIKGFEGGEKHGRALPDGAQGFGQNHPLR